MVVPAVQSYAAPCEVPVEGCSATRACDRCVDASPLAHACDANAKFLLVHAGDGYDLFVPSEESERLQRALVDAGISSELFEPGAAALSDAGCSPTLTGQAHGFVGCLTSVSSSTLSSFVQTTIGP